MNIKFQVKPIPENGGGGVTVPLHVSRTENIELLRRAENL